MRLEDCKGASDADVKGFPGLRGFGYGVSEGIMEV